MGAEHRNPDLPESSDIPGTAPPAQPADPERLPGVADPDNPDISPEPRPIAPPPEIIDLA